MPRTLKGGGPLVGRLVVPGDKSIAHRTLIFAGLSPVPVTVHGLPDGADVASTRRAMAALGAWFDSTAGGALRVEGVGAPGIGEPTEVVDCGNSGTSMRLLAGLAAGAPQLTVLAGDPSLSRRPMGRIIEPLRAMGATVLGRRGDSLPPLAIRGGALRGISRHSRVASAQVKSCLLLAGLTADGTLEIHEPGPSRDHTERMLEWWGIELTREPGHIAMEGGQPLIPPCAEPTLAIPGDLSSAAFVLVAAALRPGSDVTVEGVGVNPTRTGILDVLEEMGADLEILPRDPVGGEPVADLRIRGGERLRPFQLGGERLVRCIDEVPVLAVAAALADGTSSVCDAEDLRRKESDRLAAVASELSALGVSLEERPDGLLIHGRARLDSAAVRSHDDHRMAMALAVAAGAADGPISLAGAAAVDISWPGFFDAIEELERGGEAP
jgi:3-phosphoshikimate 1-carboxyvinyltransferase